MEFSGSVSRVSDSLPRAIGIPPSVYLAQLSRRFVSRRWKSSKEWDSFNHSGTRAVSSSKQRTENFTTTTPFEHSRLSESVRLRCRVFMRPESSAARGTEFFSS